MNTYQYTNFKILDVSGKDAKKFLQGVSTADLNIVSNQNNILLTAFANLKGRVISLCFVKFISDEQILLSVEETVLEGLLEWFKKYSMFSKVNFSLNKEYALFFTSNKGFINHSIEFKDSITTNTELFEIEKLNILAKLPIINIKNTEKFLPAELELDNIANTISYSKGCYMGQEVIARMHYKAKLKKELAVVKSTSNIKNLELRDQDNKPLANVINKVFYSSECYLLVVFHKEFCEAEFKLESGEIITKC